MNLVRFIVLLLSAIYFSPSYSSSGKYETNLSHLSAEKRKLFLEAQGALDDWTGEYEKLVSASVMIDSFIKSDPYFLPIYVEKSRLLIMTGATGQNNYEKFNQDALNVLKEVQAKDPSYPKPYVVAGHVYTNIKDFENAKKSLERAEELKTDDPWLYNNWCELYALNKQYDMAVDNAKKALVLSQDNPKALVSAIYLIDKYSKFVNGPVAVPNIQELVFESFNEPQKRLRIAERLIGAYNGNQKILTYAYSIILAQKKETPNFAEADLTMAEWLLAKGYRVTTNMIPQYEPRLSATAEQLLAPIKDKPGLAPKVFSNRFMIALSEKNIIKANDLLLDAQKNGIPNNEIMQTKALLMWCAGDYAAVANIYENLAERSPEYADNPLLMEAYSLLGSIDKLDAHHKRQVELNPTSAWTQGNYASFLLFTKKDIDGAIQHGEKALEQMRYPLAENLTSLAYLMKASIQNEKGNRSSALKNYGRAMSIGYDEEYVGMHCGKYCVGIRKLQRDYPQSSSRFGA